MTTQAMSTEGKLAGPARRVLSRKARILPFPVTGQEVALLGVVVALWIILGAATPQFLTASSIRGLLSSVAPIALMGVGMTMIIVAGGIDLSISGMLMVCAVLSAKAMVNWHTSLPITLLIGMAIGAGLGLVNGVLIAVGRVHALIITFGTWNVFLFVGYQIFNSKFVNGLPTTLSVLGAGSAGTVAGIPVSFLTMVGIAALAWCYMRYTPGGRHLYAIGSDRAASALVGIPVRRRTITTYAVSGCLVGLGACITIANGTDSLPPTVGTGTELAVIAAVVIGGASIMGGSGTVLGSVLGAVLVQTTNSGVTQLSWPSELSNLFVGVFIVIAVGIDVLRQRLRRTP